jgi:hypothetical protein
MIMTIRDEVLALAGEFGFTQRPAIIPNESAVRLIRGAGKDAPMMWIYLTSDTSNIHSVVASYYGDAIGGETYLSPTLHSIRCWLKENGS